MQSGTVANRAPLGILQRVCGFKRLMVALTLAICSNALELIYVCAYMQVPVGGDIRPIALDFLATVVAILALVFGWSLVFWRMCGKLPVRRIHFVAAGIVLVATAVPLPLYLLLSKWVIAWRNLQPI